MSKSGQRGYTEEPFHPFPHTHARNSSIKDPNYFGREHSISNYRSRNSEASLFPDVEPKFSHRALDEYVENISERNQYRSKADEIGQLENRINIMEDIMMGDKNEVTRRLIIIEEQLKGFTNFKNNYEKSLEQGMMSSSSSQRFENLENAVDHIERKLDRVSVKVKEVIKYLNEKVSDRNSKHGMILDEMKKMSETLVSCINAQTKFKTELDSIKRDEVHPRQSVDATLSTKRPYTFEDDKLPTHERHTHTSYIDDIGKPSQTLPSYRDEERETSAKPRANKHRLTEPAKQEPEVQKVDQNKLSSKRLEQRSKTQEKLERYRRMKEQSRKSEHEISNIENLSTEPPKDSRRLEGRELRENKINYWRQSGQLIANDYATFGEAGRKEHLHRHNNRDDDSWILHKSSEHVLHTDHDISHEKSTNKSHHHHHKSGRTREPLTAREHNRYHENERNRVDTERGLHALYGGIKKYEETDTSQHDVSGHHQKKRMSSSTMRPRDHDLLKYNYTQTNETTGDLLAEYLEDHHSHPHSHNHSHSHSHHDGMTRAKSNVPHCG